MSASPEVLLFALYHVVSEIPWLLQMARNCLMSLVIIPSVHGYVKMCKIFWFFFFLRAIIIIHRFVSHLPVYVVSMAPMFIFSFFFLSFQGITIFAGPAGNCLELYWNIDLPLLRDKIFTKICSSIYTLKLTQIHLTVGPLMICHFASDKSSKKVVYLPHVVHL